MTKPELDHDQLPDASTLSTILAFAADEMLSPEQARLELGLKTKQTIYNWIHDKRHPLPATKMGVWRIRRADLVRYVQEKHARQTGAALGVKESDQVLRAHVLKLLEVTKAALEFKHASLVFKAAGSSYLADTGGYERPPDEAFMGRCINELTAKAEQLLSACAGLDEDTLTRLRFMVSSITSSIDLPAPAAPAEARV